jgi:hypothetical protein
MKHKYTYKDIKDKTPQGLAEELIHGMTIASVYYYTNLGVPPEVFNEWITTILKNRAEQWWWYMNFRNEHLDLYN